MRKSVTSMLLVVILFLSTIHPVSADLSDIEKYKSFSIQNSSCDVINAVTLDLNSKPEFQAFLAEEKNKRYRAAFGSQGDVEKYVKTIDDALTKSKEIQDMQKFLWNSQKEAVKYGLNVAFKFTDKLPQTPVTNFVLPALQRGAELITDNFYDEKLQETQAQRDEFVRMLVERAAAKDASLLLTTNQTDFERVYNISQADLSGLKREDLPAFNRVMIKEAFKYLQEHRDQLQANAERLDSLTNELNTRLPAFRDEITKKVDGEFRKLGASIAELTKKQEEHTRILESLQSSVNENRERIKTLEKEMVAVQGDVVQLKRRQDEHSKLIAENSLKIDILSGYMFQNLNTDQKLSGLQQGHFDNVFGCTSGQDCPKKRELISDLNKLKTTETIISVAGTVTTSLNSGFDFATTVGLLKGEDAKRVGKAVRFIGAALQIGTGIARIYAGDISGVLSVLGGLGGLFGSGPQKSPELQFLEAMYDEMQKQFTQVKEALGVIDKKIDRLGEVLVDMYKSMMASFQYVGTKLDQIDWKIDVLQGITEALLFTDFDHCATVERARRANNFTLNTYSDYVTFYTPECGNCLKGLNDFAITDKLTYFYLESVRGYDAYVQEEVREIYEPTRDLFRAKYQAPYATLSTGALFFPAIYIKDSNRPLFIVSEEGLSSLDLDNALHKYINYEMVSKFADLLTVYSPYFEISDNNSNFEPAPLTKHLSRTPSQIGVRNSLLQARYEKLLKLTNYAIAQQSLLAGNLLIEPAYTILFTANQKDDDIRKVLRVLKNNRLFARNFASHLLHKNLRISDKPIGDMPSPSRYADFASLYEKVKQNPDDPGNVNSLNGLIYLNDFTFRVKDSDKRLYITITRLGETVDLFVPEPPSILENYMINAGALFSLFETRKKIVNRLEGLSFTRSLPAALPGDSLTLEDYKYFYTPNTALAQ